MYEATVNVNSLIKESEVVIEYHPTHSLIIPSITITDIDEEMAAEKAAAEKAAAEKAAAEKAAIADRIIVIFNPKINVLTFDKSKNTSALALAITKEIIKGANPTDHYQILIKEAMDYLKLVTYEALTITPDKRRELSFTVKDTIIKILDYELLQILYNMTKIIRRINPENILVANIKRRISKLKKEEIVEELAKIKLLEESPEIQGNLIDLFTNITSIIKNLPDYGKKLDVALKKLSDYGKQLDVALKKKKDALKYRLHMQLYDYFEKCYKTILRIRNQFYLSETDNLNKLKLAISGALPPTEMGDLRINSNALAGPYPDLAAEITNFLTPETDTRILDKYFYAPLAYVYNIIQNEELEANEKKNQKKATELREQLTTLKQNRRKELEKITKLFNSIQASKISAITDSKKGGARKRTKRKREKNNKVSQRKNKIKIKVKKHASRKARAKGKSKKGRKL